LYKKKKTDEQYGLRSVTRHFFLSFQEYEDALKYANALLKVEPENRQAHSLKHYIEDKMKKGNFTSWS
jgi:tRNA-dihydrouridine synthase